MQPIEQVLSEGQCISVNDVIVCVPVKSAYTVVQPEDDCVMSLAEIEQNMPALLMLLGCAVMVYLTYRFCKLP